LRILPRRSTIPKTAMRLQARCAVSSSAWITKPGKARLKNTTTALAAYVSAWVNA
jgi:hypothetical protein